MTQRNDIEIDYCPNCRGVWLDRGELDKIIERSNPAYPASTQMPSRHPTPPRGHEKSAYYKKREGFLSDLFDFD